MESVLEDRKLPSIDSALDAAKRPPWTYVYTIILKGLSKNDKSH